MRTRHQKASLCRISTCKSVPCETTKQRAACRLQKCRVHAIPYTRYSSQKRGLKINCFKCIRVSLPSCVVFTRAHRYITCRVNQIGSGSK